MFTAEIKLQGAMPPLVTANNAASAPPIVIGVVWVPVTVILPTTAPAFCAPRLDSEELDRISVRAPTPAVTITEDPVTDDPELFVAVTSTG